MISDDLGSVEYVVVANDLLLALIREVEDLRGEVARLFEPSPPPMTYKLRDEHGELTLLGRGVRAMASVAPDPAPLDAAIRAELAPKVAPEPQPEVEPAALSEVDQARREAAAEEAAFRARVAQGEVEGDGIIDTSTWPVHELGDTGGFR